MSEVDKPKIRIIKEYKTILDKDYTYYCYYGGRGGGKTENIAMILVLLAISRENQRILCIREIYATIRDSIRQAIVDAIYAMKVEGLFVILSNRIYCRATNTEFIFAGMGDNFARKIKSIKGVTLTWIEEASDISEKSWLTLLPSILRTPNAKMIISFNPYSADDIVYRQFVSGTPPINSYVKKVCYWDNPFFENSPLEEQRKHQLETLPYAIYSHIWEGEILTHIANALFDEVTISHIYKTRSAKIVKICIACDPASTHKDHSNEYGIIVLGKLENGDVIGLGDFSKSVSPSGFAEIVEDTFNTFKMLCEDISIVVETNQGGDFIKHTLLSNNPNYNIIEVRAGTDKINRAMPIANLCSMGKVYLDKSFDFTQLIRQMKLITYNGFMGIKGESPDRLDAFVWGVYYLADLKNFDSIETYYKKEYFTFNKEFVFKEARDILIGYIDFSGIFVLKFDILSDINTNKRVLVTDSLYFKDVIDFKEYLESIKYKMLIMPQSELTYNLGIDCSTYTTFAGQAQDFVMKNYQDIVKGCIMFDKKIPTRQYDLNIGQLIAMAVNNYKLGKDTPPFIMLLNYVVDNYRGI